MAKATKKEIKEALEAATGVSRAKGEDEQVYLARLVKKVSQLDDADWDKIPGPVQDWYNVEAENLNTKKPISSLDDDEGEAPARSRRTVAKDEPADEPADPKVGDVVIVKLEDETVQGTLLEISERSIVVDVDGEEEVYKRAKIKSIKVKAGTTKAKAEPDDEPADPKVGDTVKVVTTDDETFKGEILEMSERSLVIDIGDDEEVIKRAKVKSITVTKAAGGKAATKAKDDDEKPAPARKSSSKPKEDDEPKAKPATVRIREIICEDPDRTKEDVQKILDKEKVEVKGTTLDITFSEVSRTITLLKQYKHLK